MTQRVLVVGGAGFIGSHVVEECLSQGYEVAVADDLSSGRAENLPSGVPLYQVDIADSASVRCLFSAFVPDHIVHLAAQISVSRSVREPALDARVNIVGLLNVLENAADVQCRSFIYSSSGGVLYGEVDHPAKEDHQQNPVSPYGFSKMIGERYIQFFADEHLLSSTALRYGNVYGPRQDPHGEAGVVAILLKRLLSGRHAIINGDGGYVRDYVYVEDVARANLAALQRGSGGFRAYNVGTGIPTDVNELEGMIRSSLERELVRRGVPAPLAAPQHGSPRPGDLRSSVLDSSKIQTELGWAPSIALPEGLASTVSWFVDVWVRSGKRLLSDSHAGHSKDNL